MMKGPQERKLTWAIACVCRYKQQLSLAVEREQSLERKQVQLGLDWQHRCDDIERDQIQRSETLIQGLTKARDQVCWVLWVWNMYRMGLALAILFFNSENSKLKYQLIYSHESWSH